MLRSNTDVGHYEKFIEDNDLFLRIINYLIEHDEKVRDVLEERYKAFSFR
jgi:hypothetical protein